MLLQAPEPFAGHDRNAVAGHVELLADAGLLHASLKRYAGRAAPVALVRRLTWDGHDFLNAVRDEGVWARTKRAVAERGGAAPFAIVKALAQRYAAERFGLPPD